MAISNATTGPAFSEALAQEAMDDGKNYHCTHFVFDEWDPV